MASDRVVLSNTQLQVATVNWKHCLVKCSAEITCPPPIVWNILTHAENYKVFRDQKACIFREIVSNDDDQTKLEVEHIAKWSFALGASTYRLCQTVVENSRTNEISYQLSKPGMMKVWTGKWKIASAHDAPTLAAGNVWNLEAGTAAKTMLTLEHKMQLTVWPLPPLDKVVNGIVSKGIEDLLVDIVREADRVRKGKPQLVYNTLRSRLRLDLTSQFLSTPAASMPGTPSSTCSYNPWSEDAKVEVNSFEIDLSDIEEDEQEGEEEELSKDTAAACDCPPAAVVAQVVSRPQVPPLKLPTKQCSDIDLNPDQRKLKSKSAHKAPRSSKPAGQTHPWHAITPRSLFAAFFAGGSKPALQVADDHYDGDSTTDKSVDAPSPTLVKDPELQGRPQLQHMNGTEYYTQKTSMSAVQGTSESDAGMVKVSSFMEWLPGGGPLVTTPRERTRSNRSGGEERAEASGVADKPELSTSSSPSSMFSTSSSSSSEEEEEDEDHVEDVDAFIPPGNVSARAGRPPRPTARPAALSKQRPASRFSKISDMSSSGMVQLHLLNRSLPSHSLDQMIDAMWMGQC